MVEGNYHHVIKMCCKNIFFLNIKHHYCGTEVGIVTIFHFWSDTELVLVLIVNMTAKNPCLTFCSIFAASSICEAPSTVMATTLCSIRIHFWAKNVNIYKGFDFFTCSTQINYNSKYLYFNSQLCLGKFNNLYSYLTLISDEWQLPFIGNVEEYSGGAKGKDPSSKTERHAIGLVWTGGNNITMILNFWWLLHHVTKLSINPLLSK